MKRYRIGMMVALIFGFSSAQDVGLPKAEDLLDRYVELTGGQAAYDKITNRVSKSSVEIAGMGITLEVTACAAKPNKSYSVIESAMTGKIESGCDGEVVWEISDLQGAQVKEGQELVDMLHFSRFDAHAYWREAFTTVETVGVEDVNGSPAYKVVATPEKANPQTFYFDKASGMVVKSEVTLENPMGTFAIQSYPKDFLEVDGILVARRSSVHVMGQTRNITVDSIKHNVGLPADHFDLPEEIKAIVNQ